MCRWLAYSGNPVNIGELLLAPKDNLIQQSLHARAPRTPTNGDGFGLGWYDQQPFPGLFKSIRPAWNDFNLHDLAGHVISPLFLAHVRATSLATIQETNCHPFRYKNWLFVHNGQIADFGKLRQPLMAHISPKYFPNMLGSTDSELMFHLALSLGLEQDVPGAVSKMVQLVEATAKENEIKEAIWMTLGISDGKSIWGFRYGSDGRCPTLYVSPGASDLAKLNPEIEAKLGSKAVMLVSEPIGDYQELWRPIREQGQVLISDGNVTEKDFQP